MWHYLVKVLIYAVFGLSTIFDLLDESAVAGLLYGLLACISATEWLRDFRRNRKKPSGDQER